MRPARRHWRRPGSSASTRNWSPRLKGDVKKGLFFRGSESLPFGSAIRTGAGTDRLSAHRGEARAGGGRAGGAGGMSNLSGRIHTFGQRLLRAAWRAGAQDRARRRLHLPQPRWQQGHRRLHLLQQQVVQPQRARPAHRCTRSSTARAARHRAAHRRAKSFIAYFQAYTNTYANVDELRALYDEALAEPDVIGLSIGTRPDCVPPPVLDLLAGYRERGHEVWLELGLQSPSTKPWRASTAATAWPNTAATRRGARSAASRYAPT